MFTPEQAQRYRDWRASVPFSDDQIADCLEESASWDTVRHWELKEMARKCRRGWVSKAAVREVTHRLVKKCGLCDGKAIYHYGMEGRCRAHRDRVPLWYRVDQRWNGARYASEADALAEERRERSWERLRSLGRKRK